MKIEYQDCGAVAKVVITSTVFKLRKHNRVVGIALLSAPGIAAKHCGIFILKSVLSGKSRDMLRVYKTIQREVKR
ncbi:hypothetical protein PHA77_07760 [Edwardsiella tarda]|uniref:hypothetical protein n=1 Tax=Edwardsiella tarda TaxID=636 RepID=UPI002444CCDA|nr:hypothetical protein [Edwardsiella tarda]WGE30487.1 hypothetical protein PHA77_07760 [Edwardsiella tarda]